MSMMRNFWMELGNVQKTTLLVVAMLIVTLPLFALFFLYQKETAVLYSDIRSEDAAAIVGRLEELKIEYELSGDGNTILVNKDELYATRLKMVGKDGPVTGNAGFELFDDADYGMTEFTQKVNLKRAMQGELERTISSLDEVKFARVHLVIPEAVLFKKDKKDHKASVTLVLHSGMTVSQDQVAGVQTLVSSSVDSLTPTNVSVFNGQGQLLSRAMDDTGAFGKQSMDRVREVELHLEEKAQRTLDKIFGADNSVVSVNVDLSSRTVEKTVEAVLPVQGGSKGMLTKRKHTKTVNNSTKSGGKKGKNLADVKENTEEVFEYGRSRENSIEEPGAVTRLTISVLLPTNLTNTRMSEIESVVQNAVGFNTARGDKITVVSVLGRRVEPSVMTEEMPELDSAEAFSSAIENGGNLRAGESNIFQGKEWYILLLGVALCVISVMVVVFVKRQPRRLTLEERDRLLDDIQVWLSDNKDTALIEAGK